MNTYKKDNDRLLKLHEKSIKAADLVLGYLVISEDSEWETLYAVDSNGKIKVSKTVERPNDSFNVGGWKETDFIPENAEFCGTYRKV